MRITTSIVALALAAGSLFGCGGSSETTTSSPINGNSPVREVRSVWERNPECRHPRGASRWGCSVGPYRCQGVVTGRGWSISCAMPGKSVAFIVHRG